jgi:hypothetical protein
MNLRMPMSAVVVAVLSSCAAPGTEEASSPTTPTSSASRSAMPIQSAGSSALPSGSYGPIWDEDPATAFQDPASCENLFGLPTQEAGENVAWRISYPSDWSTQDAYLGECRWFGPEPWEADLESPVPPDEVAVVISVLDGRVTPASPEFEGGSVEAEEEFTVSGAPAVRYEIAGSDGEFLVGDGVIWVIGVQGELPDFDETAIPNYLAIYSSSADAGALAEHIQVLDGMVATLEILEP